MRRVPYIITVYTKDGSLRTLRTVGHKRADALATFRLETNKDVLTVVCVPDSRSMFVGPTEVLEPHWPFTLHKAEVEGKVEICYADEKPDEVVDGRPIWND